MGGGKQVEYVDSGLGVQVYIWVKLRFWEGLMYSGLNELDAIRLI